MLFHNSFLTHCLYFSKDSVEIHLCEACTESLTVAYSFWQQIKQSDEDFLKESDNKVAPESVIDLESVMFVETENVDAENVDTENVEENVNSEHSDEPNTKLLPVKRKLRKTKPKIEEPTEINTKKIGVNIALPHFIIEYANPNEHEHRDMDGANKSDDADSQSDSESYRKKIKTLKPSAVIPADLNKINELCRSPMEIDGDNDTQSIYKCSHCPKAFSSPHHLIIHMRKSHMCQYCLATFSKINDLYSHVKEMHRTFDCLLCSKEFQSNGNLRQHMRKNHFIFLPAHTSLLNISDVNQ